MDKQLEEILAVTSDAIVCFDASQRILLFNRRAQEIFGYTQEEVLGQHWRGPRKL